MKNKVSEIGFNDTEKLDEDKLDILKDEIASFEILMLVSEIAEIISHEIRNPMTTVRGFLQMFLHKPSLATNKEYLQMMIEELDGVNAIIGGFLTVNGGLDSKVELYDLNEIITSIIPLVQAMAEKEGKFLETNLEVLPKIMIRMKEIRHLILIMCRNSLDAMEKGRSVIISTAVHDQRVILKIKDEGRGINPEVLELIGSPFLTTKERGTGLGLSVAYSICKRHEAQIEVYTSQKGTVFTIEFKIPSIKGY